MKKKDPVLWAVVDGDGEFVSAHQTRKDAIRHVPWKVGKWISRGPFRVVKYLPAPKPKRKRKA